MDLTESFVASTLAGGRTEGDGSVRRHFKVTRNGTARDSMVLEAPVTIRSPLDNVAGAAMLECLSAPVYNVGDGMNLEVSLIEDGRARVLFRRFYDPGRRSGDRAWIPLSIPIDRSPSAAKAFLEIRLSSGPQDDLVADWLALSGLRITQRQSAP